MLFQNLNVTSTSTKMMMMIGLFVILKMTLAIQCLKANLRMLQLQLRWNLSLSLTRNLPPCSTALRSFEEFPQITVFTHVRCLEFPPLIHTHVLKQIPEDEEIGSDEEEEDEGMGGDRKSVV